MFFHGSLVCQVLSFCFRKKTGISHLPLDWRHVKKLHWTLRQSTTSSHTFNYFVDLLTNRKLCNWKNFSEFYFCDSCIARSRVGAGLEKIFVKPFRSISWRKSRSYAFPIKIFFISEFGQKPLQLTKIRSYAFPIKKNHSYQQFLPKPCPVHTSRVLFCVQIKIGLISRSC